MSMIGMKNKRTLEVNISKKLTLVGHFGVDAGMCWIGDPCYVLPDDARNNPGANWDEFCAAMLKTNAKEFNEGVCVTTGYGDGEYPVYADLGENGVVRSVYIPFTSC